MNELYNFIKSAGTVSKNIIGQFVAAHPQCAGELSRLEEEGKVVEIEKDLYQAVQ